MLYIFYGPDDFSIREELEKLRASLQDDMLPTNTTLFEGNQANAQEIANACETIPFLGQYRLVIVYDLLRRFEASTRNKAESGAGLGPWQQLAERVANFPPTAVLVLVDSDISPTNALLRALSPHAEVKQFRPLRASLLPGWIQRRASEKDMQLSPQAIQLLAANYGSNLWALSNELEKLANYATGRRVEEEDVRTLMAAAEINVFALVDAVVEGRESAALQFLRRLVAAGMESPHLLALIIRQYRLLLLAKDGQASGVNSQEMGRRLGTTSDFLLQKVMEQSSRYTQSQLREAYKRLLEADLAIKRGRQEEELALELLIADLIRQRRRELARRPA